MYRKICVLFLCFFLMGLEPAGSAFSQEKQIVGWIEIVRVFPGNLKIKAKLDTGAKNSSLNASGMIAFERDGEKWVRFEVTNWKGRTESYEARVVRITKIKEHNTAPQERPVIKLGICLGKIYKEVEVNLVDRSKFNYSMLIGRSFLYGSFIVDPAAKYTVDPACRDESQP